MKLYIDESGNTGNLTCNDLKFNFSTQPYFVLAGILLSKTNNTNIKKFICELKKTYHIKGIELKTSKLYDKNYTFISEIIQYIVKNNIPFFIEIMNKKYHMSMQLAVNFIYSSDSMPQTPKERDIKIELFSHLYKNMDMIIYEEFTKMLQDFTNESLENFYKLLLKYFKSYDSEIYNSILKRYEEYLSKKEQDPENALKNFSFIGRKNPKETFIGLLPNYFAFTNLIARANKFCMDNFNNMDFKIIHDQQTKLSPIFTYALEEMRNFPLEIIPTYVQKKTNYKINDFKEIYFYDSTNCIPIQISDILAGVAMRFYRNSISNQFENNNVYLNLIKKLNTNINYIIPINEFNGMSELLK